MGLCFCISVGILINTLDAENKICLHFRLSKFTYLWFLKLFFFNNSLGSIITCMKMSCILDPDGRTNILLGPSCNFLQMDQKVSEYEQEIPQSHTAEKPTAP